MNRTTAKHLGLGCLIAATVAVTSPAIAAADPITDFLCNSGSAQFCPARPAPGPAPVYENCDAARDAGAAPVYRNEPGYGPHLDRDNDGVGCE